MANSNLPTGNSSMIGGAGTSTVAVSMVSGSQRSNNNNRSQLEESNLRLNNGYYGGAGGPSAVNNKLARIRSADPGDGNNNYHRRATKAAVAMKQVHQPTQIESFISFVDKYRKMFDSVQTNPQVQTALQIAQGAISLILIAFHPIHLRYDISIICVCQLLTTAAYLAYRLKVVPKQQPFNPKRLALFHTIYLIVSSFWTFVISVIFFILQTEATFLQIRCCKTSTYQALQENECIDRPGNFTMAEISTLKSQCWPGVDRWRDAFYRLQYTGFGVLPFIVIQPLEVLLELVSSIPRPLSQPSSDVFTLPPGCECRVLRKGVVHLQNFLSIEQQLELVSLARELGIFRPTHLCKNEKAKSIHMMTLSRSKQALPPQITALSTALAKHCQTLTDVGPTFNSHQCVVLHYPPVATPPKPGNRTAGDRLSLHDEQGSRGCVVSLSIGDTAVFVYKKSWSKKETLKKVELKSGDAFVFGGAARAMPHGVERVLEGSAGEEIAKVMKGRLNFNVRER
ncbi:hypothetical protein HDU96_009877 [Phlyctochytrium bullatum]|nr:hypothetical protein HDU96_009877 [Phlyctochytrium bullatum]